MRVLASAPNRSAGLRRVRRVSASIIILRSPPRRRTPSAHREREKSSDFQALNKFSAVRFLTHGRAISKRKPNILSLPLHMRTYGIKKLFYFISSFHLQICSSVLFLPQLLLMTIGFCSPSSFHLFSFYSLSAFSWFDLALHIWWHSALPRKRTKQGLLIYHLLF